MTNITVIRIETSEKYQTRQHTMERDFNKVLGYNGFDKRKGMTFRADEEDFAKLSQILTKVYDNPMDAPATDKQIAYLVKLGVNVNRQLTKAQASQLIDAAKSGQGVGSFGHTMRDGSN